MYMVYWIPDLQTNQSCNQTFEQNELTKALNFANDLRTHNMHFVCLTGELSNCVGKQGADSPSYNYDEYNT